MNREILFRAKRNDNSEWVEGYYSRENGIDKIMQKDDEEYGAFPLIVENGQEYYDEYEVNPETVCQYTGLTDKNGKKIFEGHVMKDEYRDEIVSVWWNEEHSCFECREGKVSSTQVGIRSYCSVIIGNIFDNPELQKQVN